MRGASARTYGRTAGFSLLEVMLSVAILGLVLTVILSAQGGLSASNKAAANMGRAITAARCKMTETEEKLIKMGYPEIDQTDTDVSCCEDTEADGITCDVRVEKVELPNPPSSSLGDGGLLSLTSTAASAAAGAGAPPSAAASGFPSPGGGPGLNLSTDGGLQALGSQVAGQFGMGPGGPGADGLLQMAMGFVYPTLKPVMEASIRRITVVVRWKEGRAERQFPLVQYVTNPQRGGLLSGVPPTVSGGAPGTAPGTTGPGTAAAASPGVR